MDSSPWLWTSGRCSWGGICADTGAACGSRLPPWTCACRCCSRGASPAVTISAGPCSKTYRRRNRANLLLCLYYPSCLSLPLTFGPLTCLCLWFWNNRPLQSDIRWVLPGHQSSCSCRTICRFLPLACWLFLWVLAASASGLTISLSFESHWAASVSAITSRLPQATQYQHGAVYSSRWSAPNLASFGLCAARFALSATFVGPCGAQLPDRALDRLVAVADHLLTFVEESWSKLCLWTCYDGSLGLVGHYTEMVGLNFHLFACGLDFLVGCLPRPYHCSRGFRINSSLPLFLSYYRSFLSPWKKPGQTYQVFPTRFAAVLVLPRLSWVMSIFFQYGYCPLASATLWLLRILKVIVPWLALGPFSAFSVSLVNEISWGWNRTLTRAFFSSVISRLFKNLF